MKNHFNIRKEFYVKRHKFLIGKWEADCAFITNKARFVLENIEKKISVMNKKKKVLIEELYKAKYDSDPVKGKRDFFVIIRAFDCVALSTVFYFSLSSIFPGKKSA